MDFKKSKKLLAILAVSYWVLVIVIDLAAGSRFHFTAATTDALSASGTIGELTEGVTVTQTIEAPAEQITQIELLASTYGRGASGTLHIVLMDESGEVLARQDADAAALEDGRYTTIPFQTPFYTEPGKRLTLQLTTTGSEQGGSISVYYGNTVTAGRFDVVKNIAEEDQYKVDGVSGQGMLCVKLSGIRALTFYRDYWLIVAGVFAVVVLLCKRWWKQAKMGRNNPLVSVCTLQTRYSFLLRQLVSRDFKTKYKRSVLGMAWSFLNPLLTMSVQYIVFSTLFNSDIPNYPVYLLSGIVFFNFFNEAVGMCMTSITGNASLIKKVYIPLFLVTLITGTRITPALLLLVFDILCLLGFVMGMGLLLTTAMTFFQDTQFLWGVISMMWMYLTPVFYPESIIPAKFLTLYHMNPMYQYITFARICIIDGVSPEPMAYLWCIVSSLVVLALGIVTFKRNQDKFVLYL